MIDYQALKAGFNHVMANQGCDGVDGVTIIRFETGLRENLGTLDLMKKGSLRY